MGGKNQIENDMTSLWQTTIQQQQLLAFIQVALFVPFSLCECRCVSSFRCRDTFYVDRFQYLRPINLYS